ncbi:MAG: HAD hydrolase-like protein [Oscillibacter sp.]|nr:HAD hydrolase-like protein [Oscillibacter sp.]
MYRYIFFDLDGTLTDSKEGVILSARYAIEKMGYPQPDEATMLKFVGPPLVDSFMEHCGFTREQAERAVELYRERYVPIGLFENAPAPGAAELLARLREKGYQTALASSKPEVMCETVCTHFGFTPHLDVISGSPLHGDYTKADVIRAAMARLGLTAGDAAEILMVGDRKYDVLGAAECGIACVGLKLFGYAEEGELEDAGAVAMVQDLKELEVYILSH